MGLMDRVKKTGMSIMYDYLDKDPDRNLPKITIQGYRPFRQCKL